MSITDSCLDNQGLAVGAIALADKPTLAEHARAIRELGKRAVANYIEIGRHLAEVREQVDAGEWSTWLEDEFDWSDQTARRFIHVFQLSRDGRLNKLLSADDLPISVIYRLAAPKAEQARQELAERWAAGEEITRDKVEEAVARQKTTDSGVANNSEEIVGDAAEDAGEALTDERILREVWRGTALEHQAKIIQSEPADRLLELMSEAQRAALFAASSDDQRRKYAENAGLDDWLKAMPPAWFSVLKGRVERQATRATKALDDTISKSLRQALSLQKGTKQDATAVGVANALNALLNKLAAAGLDINDLKVTTPPTE